MKHLKNIAMFRLRYYLQANDADHGRALRETGFWGQAGAGCVCFAKDTNKFLLLKRSEYVQEPNTYGTVGGAIDAGEDPKESVIRELDEETGYNGAVKLVPLLIFKKPNFKYYNYLAIAPKAFVPKLNWENSNYKWFAFDDWPHPLHFGVKSILDDNASMRIMENYANGDR